MGCLAVEIGDSGDGDGDGGTIPTVATHQYERLHNAISITTIAYSISSFNLFCVGALVL